MIKKQIYPKTERLKNKNYNYIITEKMDGSNLCIFKKEDKLYIAQRNNIIELEELEEGKKLLYKGLHNWLLENKEELKEIHNNSVLCGEWLGMGKIKYDVGDFDKRFYMFAKANIDNDFNFTNIQYNQELFIYPFLKQEIPNFIGIVPKVEELKIGPSKKYLDNLYEKYTNKVKRNVEGFIINYNNKITKYVRMKNGIKEEHFDRE